MNKRILGNTDLNISRLGMGAWAIGGNWEYGWGDQDDRDSIDTILKAVASGMNWIDTAPAYGLGHSETVIGRALQQLDTKPYIFTKCGIVWDSEGRNWPHIKADSIVREIDASLERLGVDQIDLYQIHWPIEDKDLEAAWQAMERIQSEGKVRYIGVSNCSVEQLQRLSVIAPVSSLQPPYSLINREAEESILPYCHDNGIGVINYSPMGSGLLSGKMDKASIDNLSENDWRRKSEDFLSPKLEKTLALVEQLRVIGKRHNCSAGEVAIAWTLNNPAVTASIVGLRKPQQVEGIVKAGSLVLSQEDMISISDYLHSS